jgi:hypothetical protein
MVRTRGRGSRTTFRRRQGSADAAVQGQRAYGVLLKVGAGCAAVASIVGLGITFSHLWPGGGAPPNAIVALGEPQVSEPMTYKTYAKLRRWKTDGLSQEELQQRGVKVDYRATVTGAPLDTAFEVRMTILKLEPEGATVVDTQDGEGFKTTQDPDVFDLHSFVWARGPGRYKLELEVPDVSGSSSKASVESTEFRFRNAAT